MIQTTQPLLNEHEAAAIINQKVSTLRNWRVVGSPIPFIKIGRSVRYVPADITAFIAASRTHSTTEAQAKHAGC